MASNPSRCKHVCKMGIMRGIYQDDLFKKEFRYYKRKIEKPDLSNVIDFSQPTHPSIIEKLCCRDRSSQKCVSNQHLGLKETCDWKIYGLEGKDGFYFISNPFTEEGQRKWIKKSVDVYPKKPAITNLDIHHNDVDEWPQENFLQKLRWCTVGYHHNWDTKVYSKESFSVFPLCLRELIRYISSAVGFTKFQPEAAIVNYYKLDSTLAGHVDNSELDQDAPIVSLSFGQSAVFLLGSETKNEKPLAMYLRSGDVVIMSSSCRLAYHAVPLIIPDGSYLKRCSDFSSCDNQYLVEYLKTSRININVRQVFTFNKD